MVVPSGEKAQAFTARSWPAKVARRAAVAASHSRRVASSLAETMLLLSGEKAHPFTQFVVAGERGALGAGDRIPELEGGVVASRDDRSTVG